MLAPDYQLLCTLQFVPPRSPTARRMAPIPKDKAMLSEAVWKGKLEKIRHDLGNVDLSTTVRYQFSRLIAMLERSYSPTPFSVFLILDFIFHAVTCGLPTQVCVLVVSSASAVLRETDLYSLLIFRLSRTPFFYSDQCNG